ncbi:MAG TPA: NAD-dependent epimerase/dehydratase family protein [Patescibacteria group bacterium]|nr:NAD-dependent epimerase/dehydratase family protein [Patescibacteria group bacterium]
MKNKILITGGAGYIGSRLADKLISEGFDVVVIDNLSSGKRENINKKAKLYEIDIKSQELHSIFKKEDPEIIFHLAASKDVNKSVVDPVSFADTNILGSLNVIDAAHKAQIKRIIFTSTAGIYGDSKDGMVQSEKDLPHPSSPYAWTKLAIEEYLLYMNSSCSMENIILRFANVYGPGEAVQNSVVNIFIKKLIEKEEVVIHGDGSQTRDFVYIDDLVKICSLLISIDFSRVSDNPVFNISTGREISVNDLLSLVSEKLNQSVSAKYERNTFIGQKSSILDTSKTKDLLDWKATTMLSDGIHKTIEYFKEENK